MVVRYSRHIVVQRMRNLNLLSKILMIYFDLQITITYENLLIVCFQHQIMEHSILLSPFENYKENDVN